MKSLATRLERLEKLSGITDEYHGHILTIEISWPEDETRISYCENCRKDWEELRMNNYLPQCEKPLPLKERIKKKTEIEVIWPEGIEPAITFPDDLSRFEEE